MASSLLLFKNLRGQFAFIFPTCKIESLDDDIHLILKMKGFFLPQFYYMKTHHGHNRM
jgi:hypothetical protein